MRKKYSWINYPKVFKYQTFLIKRIQDNELFTIHLITINSYCKSKFVSTCFYVYLLCVIVEETLEINSDRQSELNVVSWVTKEQLMASSSGRDSSYRLKPHSSYTKPLALAFLWNTSMNTLTQSGLNCYYATILHYISLSGTIMEVTSLFT